MFPKARERLERAISKAWQMGPSGQPQAMSDPNIPLRVLVKSPPGLRIMGRAWLEKPVLHWDTSEIDCIGKPWAPSSQQSSSAQAIQFLASIEVWDEDLVRLTNAGCYGVEVRERRGSIALGDYALMLRCETAAWCSL